MTTPFGFTRSVVKPNYALFTPAGLVSSSLPGWSDAQCQIVIAPQLGARFYQTLITLGAGGLGESRPGPDEYLLFVLDGEATLRLDERSASLAAGGYAYIPPQARFSLRSGGGETRLLLFQRRYLALPGVVPPQPIVAHEDETEALPFMGDEGALLKVLLPDTPAFDMAVNIFTFQPGATLPMVETHIMEHGMMFIQGGGIYRLDADWHPVQNGDTIWMAPYCPQWFVATGKTPARYIYYKDVNRDPLSDQTQR
jgi:(S)-ureidoglycine aminohydrolase